MTSTFDTTQMTKQFESMFFGPARAYAELSTTYIEKLIAVQFDAGKACSDAGLAQLHNLINVKDADGLREYMEGQQQTASDLTERLKSEAEKVVVFRQDFFKDSQKLAEENFKHSQKFFEENQDNIHPIEEASDSKAKPSQQRPLVVPPIKKPDPGTGHAGALNG